MNNFLNCLLSICAGGVAYLTLKIYETSEYVDLGDLHILLSLTFAVIVCMLCKTLDAQNQPEPIDRHIDNLRIYEDEDGETVIEFVGEKTDG